MFQRVSKTMLYQFQKKKTLNWIIYNIYIYFQANSRAIRLSSRPLRDTHRTVICIRITTGNSCIYVRYTQHRQIWNEFLRRKKVKFFFFKSLSSSSDVFAEMFLAMYLHFNIYYNDVIWSYILYSGKYIVSTSIFKHCVVPPEGHDDRCRTTNEILYV